MISAISQQTLKRLSSLRGTVISVNYIFDLIVGEEKERRERLALEEQKRAVQDQDKVLVKKPSLPTLEDIEQGTLIYRFKYCRLAVTLLLSILLMQLGISFYTAFTMEEEEVTKKEPEKQAAIKSSQNWTKALIGVTAVFTLIVHYFYTRGRVASLTLSRTGDWLFVERINIMAMKKKEHFAVTDAVRLPDPYGRMKIKTTQRTTNVGKIADYSPINPNVKKLIFDRLGKWSSLDVLKKAFAFKKK
ncbi:hypothetical protein PROFUN_07315 [Planoprotostelium fungivorum]|uniref:Transmembrane protein n=1 Tax=Planoprotostelium fungivorum TaxID=1890364 RepID=A0A2P6MVM7_9EUKA|nr:hypothetical protein PROFUN_15583 [Planoprotostelium fungivorum]PRP85027.1 hypothetical protein PROFUN_07315 [Planoprotostelium fungivorum]